MNFLFNPLLNVENLCELHIDYSLEKNYQRYEGRGIKNLEKLFAFKTDQINVVEAFLEKHSCIKTISLKDWPGLQLQNLKHCRQICERKHINLIFKQYF